MVSRFPQFSQYVHLLLAFVLLVSSSSNLYSQSFADLIAKGREGSTYSIKQDYNLAGKTVTIPNNCILSFEGGSVKNGTIVYQNTRIVGDAKMEVTPKGTIAGRVTINWFGLRRDDKNFDNGAVFNKVGQVFPYLYVEPGEYYCKTIINWGNNVIRNLQIDGNLHYVKQNTGDTFIMLRTTRGVVTINGQILGPTQNITDGNTREKSVGICFKDCNNSRFFLNSIGFFYKNIEVLGSSEGYGNAYNDYAFVESYAAKILVHLSSEKKGWTTSNVYKLLRLTTYGGYTMPETGLLIQGEDTDLSGNFSDTVIEKLCIEGLKKSEPIKIIGANRFVINNIRNEDNYPTLCYCKNVIGGKIYANYGDVTIRPDASTYVDVTTSAIMDFYEPLAKSYLIDADGRYRLFNCVDAEMNSTVRYSPLFYTPVGMVVSAGVLGKPLHIQCEEDFTLDVVYYDKNRRKLSATEVAAIKPAGSIQFTKSNVIANGYMTSSRTRSLNFVCPKGNDKVAYVGLFLRSLGNNASPMYSISHNIASAVETSLTSAIRYKEYLSSGPTASRPVFRPEDAKYSVGYQYYDTSLGKTVYVKSINSNGVAVWVDANGNIK